MFLLLFSKYLLNFRQIGISRVTRFGRFPMDIVTYLVIHSDYNYMLTLDNNGVQLMCNTHT